MSHVYVVIPARYGSSRLEGKPLLEINGKPLFWHVYQRCVEADFSTNNIFLATDDERIFQKAKMLGIQVVMTSKDHDSGTDRINEVALKMNWNSDDLVINVQGDEPLIPENLIRQVADFSASHSLFSITTVITPIIKKADFANPNVVKAVLGEGARALYFTRSASPLNRDNENDLSMAYRHIGIYSYKVSALSEFCSYRESPLENYEKLEQLRALANGMPIGATIYHGSLPHGVDTMEDYIHIKKLME